MTFRLRLIRSLLYIYPATWRAEYGPELDALLASRPLTAAVVLDVIWNSLIQRLRHSEPWKVAAGCLLAWTTVGMVWNTLRPWSNGEYARFTNSIFLVLFAAACWTTFRGRDGIKTAAEGAAKAALISTLPDILICVL